MEAYLNMWIVGMMYKVAFGTCFSLMVSSIVMILWTVSVEVVVSQCSKDPYNKAISLPRLLHPTRYTVLWLLEVAETFTHFPSYYPRACAYPLASTEMEMKAPSVMGALRVIDAC